MGGEGARWGEPRACGRPAPGQWTARAAPPVPLWRDGIHLGPGGCPPLPRTSPILLVPESWSHWSLGLCVKLLAERKGAGRAPAVPGPQERERCGGLGWGQVGPSKGAQVQLTNKGRYVGAAHSRCPCRGPGILAKVAGREAGRDNALLAFQRGNVWPSTPPTPPTPQILFPSSGQGRVAAGSGREYADSVSWGPRGQAFPRQPRSPPPGEREPLIQGHVASGGLTL